MIPQDFFYAFPVAAALLFLLPLIFILFSWLYYSRRKNLSKFTSFNLQRKLIIPRERWIFWFKVTALSLVWTFATLALMQPKGNGHYPEEKEGATAPDGEASLQLKAHDVLFLIDASASMSIHDGRMSDTRLQQSKDIADEIFSLLEGESSSLYAFTSRLTKMSPFTMDYFFLRMMLRDIRIDEGGTPGTDFYATLSALPPTTPENLKTIILLSDGGDTKLQSLPENQQQAYIQSIVDLFNKEGKRNLRIYTVGLGTNGEDVVPQVTFGGKPVQAPLDDRILQALALNWSGKYYKAAELSAIQISQDIASRMHTERVLFNEGQTIHTTSTRELLYNFYYQIPLGIAIFLLSFVLLFPDSLRLNNLMVFLLLLIPFQHSYAQNSEMQQANAYADSGDTQEAIALYTKLLQQSKASWKKNIYLHNTGVIYLKEGSWQKAVDTFQSIEHEVNPLLSFYLTKNLALARYKQASSIDPLTSQDFLQKIYQLRDSLQQITTAKQAACDLQKLEGRSVCIPENELYIFRNQVKKTLSLTLKDYEIYRIQQLEVRDGIPELLYSLSLLKENNILLDNPSLKSDLKKAYQGFLLKESSSWMPLWHTMHIKFEGDQKSSLNRSLKHYTEAIAALESNEYSKSTQLALESEKELLQLLKQILDESSPEEFLQSLLEMYQQISIQEILPEAILIKLQSEQRQISSLLNSETKETIEPATHLLDLSLQSLQQSEPTFARLFFEAAYHRIKQLLPQRDVSPKVALNHAIEIQEYALTINRLMLKNQQRSNEVLPLIIQGQKDTLMQAQHFYSSVFQAQTKGFEEGICQKTPWNTFLPSFNLGYFSATEAMQALQTSPNQAIGKQEETLFHWKQLQKEMENKKEEMQEIKQTAQKEVSEVLQSLQEMSNDDQIQKKSTRSTKQQVERPW